jgi:electron transport complex protein RnfC
VFRRTFSGGIHPLYYKELTRHKKTRLLEQPSEVIIPLAQHVGAPCQAAVKKGDEVKAGTVIAKSDKLISSLIHSSISGVVKNIKKYPHPVTGYYEAIAIESDSKNEREFLSVREEQDPQSLDKEKIKELIHAAGIVGLGGAAFPTHVKLTPPKDKKIDTFILNAAECEPYLTCDERTMLERPKDVLKGAILLLKALGLKRGIVAIEDNKPEAFEALKSALNDLRFTDYDLGITKLHTKYPQGGEKQLIKALLNREVPSGGLPFDVGCLVDNVQTATAVFDAVYKGKPLYERTITVTGDAIKEPANLLVKIGTPLSYIIEQCGGFTKEVGKLVVGGPMMGVAQYTDQTPVIKGTSGILVLSKKYVSVKPSEHCIRCGRCIEACPVKIMPTDIAKAAEYGRFDIAETLHVADCIECGCCAFVCPSRIPLVQLIKHAKRSLLCQI